MASLGACVMRSDFRRYLKANRMNFLIWAGLVFAILIIFHFLSDGDFSFLLVRIWVERFTL